MKPQAIKCSKMEIHWLNYWRRQGRRIGRNQPIPCTAKMPPRRGTLRIFLALVFVIAVYALITIGFAYWGFKLY